MDKFVNYKVKTPVTCPLHGDWYVRPSDHIRGSGCPSCAHLSVSKARKVTKDNVISRFKKVHGDLYDYKNSEYIDTASHITIECKLHGSFQQIVGVHLKGSGCPECGKKKIGDASRDSPPQLLQKCRAVHHDKYQYILTDNDTHNSKVRIECPFHGEFKQKLANHLQGNGCPLCSESGFNKSKPANLYILKCDSITKIGISNNHPSKRAKSISNSFGKKFEVVGFINSSDGNLIYNIERELLKILKTLYQQPLESFSGSTECFYNVDLNNLVDIISSNFKILSGNDNPVVNML